MRKLISIFTISIIAFSCTKQQDDKAKIERTIKDFLVWYSANWDSISVKSIQAIIENSMLDVPDSTKPFRVNFDAVETYVGTFTMAGYMSDDYAKEWREYFRECQTEFEKNPQYWGPAYGFETEFVFRTQIYLWLKDNPTKAEVSEQSISGNKATAVVTWNESKSAYKYFLSKDGDTWKIDRIRGIWESN